MFSYEINSRMWMRVCILLFHSFLISKDFKYFLEHKLVSFVLYKKTTKHKVYLDNKSLSDKKSKYRSLSYTNRNSKALVFLQLYRYKFVCISLANIWFCKTSMRRYVISEAPIPRLLSFSWANSSWFWLDFSWSRVLPLKHDNQLKTDWDWQPNELNGSNSSSTYCSLFLE